MSAPSREGHDPSGGDGPRPVEEDVPSGAGAILYVLVALVPLGLVLGPLGTVLIWWLRRDEPFLDGHGRQALDVMLSALVLGGGLFLIARVSDQSLLEWAAFAVAGYYFVLTLVGGVIAMRGRFRRLPLALPLLRRRGHI